MFVRISAIVTATLLASTATAGAATILRDTKACPIKGGLCLLLTGGTPVTPFVVRNDKTPAWIKAPESLRGQATAYVYIGDKPRGEIYAIDERAIDAGKPLAAAARPAPAVQ